MRWIMMSPDTTILKLFRPKANVKKINEETTEEKLRVKAKEKVKHV